MVLLGLGLGLRTVYSCYQKKNFNLDNVNKQAGAELGQAQPELELRLS